jgi:hypothetical protein
MKSGRIGRLFKEHNTIVTYAAALIIFLTFVVREGLRERWRESSDTMDAAINTAMLEHATTSLALQLDEVANKLDALGESSALRSKEPASYLRAEHKLKKLDNSEFGMSLERGFVNILISKLPEHSSLRHELSDIVARFDENRAQSIKLHHAFYRAVPESAASSLEGLDQIAQQYGKQIEVLSASYDNLDDRIIGLARDTIGEAKQVRARNDWLSRIAWWISAILFTVGWGLGLAAKLYGLPERAEAE